MSPRPDTTLAPAQTPARTVLPMLYAGAVVVAALYFGRELFVPLVLASLLAFVLAPACGVLQHLKLPRVAAVIIVVLLAFATIGGLGTIVGHEIADLASDLPTYQTTVLDKWHALSQGGGWLRYLMQGAPGTGGQGTPAAAAMPAQETTLPFGLGEVSGFTLARNVAQPLLGPLETGGIVLVFTIFVLLSSEDLRDRLVRLVGRHDLHRTIVAMNDAAGRLSQYFLYQLGLNAGFGVLIGLSLWLTGLPNPLLWGILAALMRFVPYIGVFIALVPPLMLALAVVPGWSLALLVLALFVGSEAIMGQVVEPLIYGHSTGLSPLAVIVATAFWALLWGPIGLLIATPLTVCLVVIGRHVEALAFLDVMLGDAPPLEPYETFYQRALEGRAALLVPRARTSIAASSLTDYYDRVALPGLALAQGDLVRDTLAFERLEAIHGEIETLLDDLEAKAVEPRSVKQAAADLPRAWSGESAVLCIPGRGQLDDLAATMAVQALHGAGFGAGLAPNLVLGASSEVDLGQTRICCLSVLEEGSSVAGIRYFIRRMEKRMPNAEIVVGLWHARRDSASLSALRAEGGTEHVVLSIGELIAFARAASARGARRDASMVARLDATRAETA